MSEPTETPNPHALPEIPRSWFIFAALAIAGALLAFHVISLDSFLAFVGIGLAIVYIFGWNVDPVTFFGYIGTLGTILVSLVYLVSNRALEDVRKEVTISVERAKSALQSRLQRHPQSCSVSHNLLPP